MKERPVLFNGPMVRAILDGRKTMTRRIIKQHHDFGGAGGLHGGEWDDPHQWGHADEAGEWVHLDTDYACPLGCIGDQLWVRETHYVVPGNTKLVLYRASCENGCEKNYKWRPSIHMPRWASRITLEITDVRVERLNDISEKDAIAEGIHNQPIGNIHVALMMRVHRYGFANLWESIYGKGSWEVNPFVWVVSFKRVGGDHGNT